jgi:hypothetical protein
MSIKSKGIVQFIVLHRDVMKEGGKEAEWEIPPRRDFHRMVNRIECKLFREAAHLLPVKDWANMWGNMGVLGLNVRDIKRYGEFRDYIENTEIEGKEYTIYPRDGLLRQEELTALLRDDLESFDVNLIPTALFWRNSGLAGQLRVSKIKQFGKEDKTRGGISKTNWRLIKLEGDRDFMDSLYNFTSLHKFQLGSSYIQIRGGKRRAPTQKELEAFSRPKDKQGQKPSQQTGSGGYHKQMEDREGETSEKEIEEGAQLAPHPWLGKE